MSSAMAAPYWRAAQWGDWHSTVSRVTCAPYPDITAVGPGSVTSRPASSPRRVRVVVGADGSGRTHVLRALAATEPACWWRPGDPVDRRRLVLADDAHRLDGPSLAALTEAVRAGCDVALARRPTIGGGDLAALEEAITGLGGDVVALTPLGDAEIAVIVATVTGRAARADDVAAVVAASAGSAAVAAALAADLPVRADRPGDALTARVERALAAAGSEASRLATVLATGVALDDAALAHAADLDERALVDAFAALADVGVLAGGRLVPAVSWVVERRHAAATRAARTAVAGQLSGRGDAVAVATVLRAAGASDASAAAAYARAGEALRFADPAAAINWLDAAAAAGADPAALAAARVEVAVQLGEPLPVVTGATAPARLALALAAHDAHDGRWARAAERFVAAGGPGVALAVPGIVATGGTVGRLDVDAAPPAVAALAAAARRSIAPGGDPHGIVPAWIEAAELAERMPPALVLPDTAAALGATVAALVGDVATAADLLTRDPGSGAAAVRHRLLRAFVWLRAGRYDAAIAVTRDGFEPHLGRDRLLAAAVRAGLARRAGDIARLRDAWSAVEPVLARRAVDLFQLEALEELLAAAARLRHHRRIAPVLDELTRIVDDLGRPPTWAVAHGWLVLQLALADDDVSATRRAATDLAAHAAPFARQRAQQHAAEVWADVLDGAIDGERVMGAADALAAGELPWEGSRLLGQAAIRAREASLARRLLERARDLAGADAAGVGDGDCSAGVSGLSERELDVARLVLAGRTHREIGAQLYIAAKTVEHHVARIRTKLGATTRAELLAALREMVDDAG
jgi:DNA-binding CsgD family transcriptional regulator